MALHCGRCGSTGHNITRCNNMGVPVKKRPKKQQEAGPSQASQSTQATQASQATPASQATQATQGTQASQASKRQASKRQASPSFMSQNLGGGLP
ncbi:unnamed protein product [Arabidopsis halleri]